MDTRQTEATVNASVSLDAGKTLKVAAEENKTWIRLLNQNLEARKWFQLKQLHEHHPSLLLPNVPRYHIPIGYVVIPFRTIRESVLSEKPIRYERPLRGAARGTIKIDMEYRPKFWDAQHRKEIVRCETPRGNELEWKDPAAALKFPVPSKPPEDLLEVSRAATLREKYKKRLSTATSLTDCLHFSRKVQQFLSDDTKVVEPKILVSREVQAFLEGAKLI